MGAWVKIRNFLKKLNCCNSSCLNQTIDNSNMEKIDALVEQVGKLGEAIIKLGEAQ